MLLLFLSISRRTKIYFSSLLANYQKTKKIIFNLRQPPRSRNVDDRHSRVKIPKFTEIPKIIITGKRFVGKNYLFIIQQMDKVPTKYLLGPKRKLTLWNRSKMHENIGRNGPRPNRTGNDIEYLISCDRFVETFTYLLFNRKWST